jgi:hypothetical protein
MAGAVQAEQFGRDGWGDAVVIAGEPGTGLQAVDKRKDACAFNQTDSINADLAGERNKDAMDLRLLFLNQAYKFVVLLNGFEGLDVYRLP